MERWWQYIISLYVGILFFAIVLMVSVILLRQRQEAIVRTACRSMVELEERVRRIEAVIFDEF